MKRYLIAGLVIWIPLVITLWVLRGIVTTMDELVTPLMPGDWRPETWLGIAVPGTPLRMMRATSSSFVARRKLPPKSATPRTTSPRGP